MRVQLPAVFLSALSVLASAALACGGSGSTGSLRGGGGGPSDIPGVGNGGTGPSGLPIPGSGGLGFDAGTGPQTPPYTDAGTADTAPPPPVPGYPAAHAAPPQAASSGGPTIANPTIIAITFPNEPFLSEIHDFVSTLGATPFWSANVAAYGVGPATAGTPVEIDQTPGAAIDDSQIQQWIAQEVTAGVLPTPDANTIFTLFYPQSTSITLQGSTSCQTFGGYHYDALLANGSRVSYAVLPRCGDIGELTGATTHELIEASTDPLPDVNPAHIQVDQDHIVWQLLLGGGEVGDLCAQFQDSFYQPTGFPYVVQRCWSNVAATAGHDPCAPELPGEVYFNSAPVLDDAVTLTAQGQSIPTKGVLVPLGQSKTIEVDLFSDAPTSGEWTVQAVDSTQLSNNGGSPQLTLALDKSSGKNGDQLHLTITPLQQGGFGGEAFALVSTLGQTTKYWFGFVAN